MSTLKSIRSKFLYSNILFFLVISSVFLVSEESFSTSKSHCHALLTSSDEVFFKAKRRSIVRNHVEGDYNVIDINSLVSHPLWQSKDEQVVEDLVSKFIKAYENQEPGFRIGDALASIFRSESDFIIDRMHDIKNVMESPSSDSEPSDWLRYRWGILVNIDGEQGAEMVERYSSDDSYRIVSSVKELEALYLEDKKIVDDEMKLFERLMKVAGEDLTHFMLEGRDYGPNEPYVAGEISFLHYAVRYANMDKLGVIVNHPAFNQSLSFKEAKPLLKDAQALWRDSADREGRKMAVYMAMTKDAYQSYQKSWRALGRRLLEGTVGEWLN